MNDYQSLHVFFDSDALIAGSASRTGASFLLLQLCEMKVLRGVTSVYVLEECRRNLTAKLSEALPLFEQILELSLEIKPDAAPEKLSSLKDFAHPKDIPVLAAALEANSDFLITFNTKHYTAGSDIPIQVITPGELLAIIRSNLNIQINE